MFAILRGANGRRHEVDFGDDPVTIDVAMSPTTVQVTMAAADPGDPARSRFVTVALPRGAGHSHGRCCCASNGTRRTRTAARRQRLIAKQPECPDFCPCYRVLRSAFWPSNPIATTADVLQ